MKNCSGESYAVNKWLQAVAQEQYEIDLRRAQKCMASKEYQAPDQVKQAEGLRKLEKQVETYQMKRYGLDRSIGIGVVAISLCIGTAAVAIMHLHR